MSSGGLIVYGARCTWWGSPEDAGRTGSGLPVCPYCGSPLFQLPAEDWFRGADTFRPLPGSVFDGVDYPAFLRWSRGRQCAPGNEAGMAALVELFKYADKLDTSERLRNLRPIPVADRMGTIARRTARSTTRDDADRRRRKEQKRSRRKNR